MAPSDKTKAETHCFTKQPWTNKHQNLDETLAELCQVWNPTKGKKIDRYKETTRALLRLVDKKAARGKKLRALGSGWSLSRMPLTEGTHVDTTPLNLFFRVAKKFMSASYVHKDTQKLFLAQCGVSIERLHDRLFAESEKRSLKTAGSSNGQTIVGAISTGTHGSAVDEPPIQEAVVGIHLITGGSRRHIWLERDSYPVLDDKFVDLFDSTLVRDDALFDAALVSFGCFGLIHSVLLETAPIFTLELYRRRIAYNAALKGAIGSWDFSELDLPKNTRPHHFELTFNPNKSKTKAYLKVIYKHEGLKEPRDAGRCKHAGADGLTMFEILMTDLGGVLFKGTAKKALNKEVEKRFGPCGPASGTLGEIFGTEKHEGAVISSGLAMPTKFAVRAIELAFEVYDDFDFFPGLVSLRFTRKSRATLAFTRFQKTCVFEIDGLKTPRATKYMNAVFKRIKDAGIPHAYHWGKMHRMGKKQVETAYGSDLAEWKQAREDLLETAALRRAFSSEFTDKLGLTS